MICVGFTRPRRRLPESIALVESMGMKAFAAPSLEIDAGCPEAFNEAKLIISSGKADLTIFGSVTGVEQCIREFGDDFIPMMKKTSVICTGPSTSKYLKDHTGIEVGLLPQEYSSAGILRSIRGSVDGKTIVLLRADSSSPELRLGLEKKGAMVRDIAVYRIIPAEVTEDTIKLMEAIRTGKLDAMAFTSPLSATSFFEDLDRRYGKQASRGYMDRLRVAAIGIPTSEALGRIGRMPDIVPEKATFESMMNAVKAELSQLI
jgi:uroporphyrinogen-III synthase